MGKADVFTLMIFAALLIEINCLPPKFARTVEINPSNNKTIESNNGNNNKTIAELVQQQTDTIKKIVSSHHHHQQQPQQQQQVRPEYPVITKYEAEEKQQKIKQDIDKLTYEELKIRCQHLSNLLNQNKTNKDVQKVTTLNPTKINSKIQTFHKPNKGFYITTEATTTTTKKPTEPTKITQNVKLIKLEPVILQKTVLSDGRTIYYWHKSLPSAVQFPLQPQQQIHDRYDIISTTTTKPSTTTTTISSYDFRNFFPSFYSIRNVEQQTSTTTEKTTTTPTTTTTTTEKPSTTSEKNDEIMYSHQLKFVVPIPFANPDSIGVRKPWEFDQFAYYPKPLQPETVNVEMPYVPTFHIIKALAIPNKYDAVMDDNYDSIDNVNI